MSQADTTTSLAGQVALVTGAARGIGQGIALALARLGADLVLNDLPPEPGDTTLAETMAAITALGRRVLLAPADVSDRPAMETAFAQAITHFGRLDIIVANVGISHRQPLAEVAWEKLERVFQVTQFGAIHACQLGARQLVAQAVAGRPGGRILLIGSVHAYASLPGSTAYDMIKAGLTQFARTLAYELSPHRITVNIIHPGWIDTPGERQHASEAELRVAGAKLPLGRLGTTADIGHAAAFLCGPQADYITGAALLVDGGFLLRH
jgi:glucose 1-dehydrogenase